MKCRLSALAPIALAACAAYTPPPQSPGAEANKPSAADIQAADNVSRCWRLIDAVRAATRNAAACDPAQLDRLGEIEAFMKEICDRAEAQNPPTLQALRTDRALAEAHGNFINRSCTPEQQTVP